MGVALSDIVLFAHPTCGVLATLAGVWVIVEALNATEANQVRTRRAAFLSRPGKAVAALAIGASVLTLALPFAPFHRWLGLVPLPALYYGYLLLVMAAFLFTTELVKRVFYARLQPRLR